MADHVTRSRRLEAQQQEQSRARWTTSLTKILAELMVEQVQKGNKHNNLFNKKAWKYICDEFYKKTGLKWDKEQLKNRYSVMRKQYSTVKSILDQSEFSWDEATGSITASDKTWAEYIKKHADAETLRTSGCPIFKELCAIFSEPATNGKHEHLTVSKVDHTPRPVCPQPLRMPQEESSSRSQDEDDANDPETPQPSTPAAAASSRKKGRKGINDAIAEAILEMAAASKMRATAIEQYNARSLQQTYSKGDIFVSQEG
ncbi:hypothetical protein PIB30_119042 [Stylosanthes scabra]|uniref:Myb/SANT-like domain-containing protein n=1 Tax=Stylosanthes scabra TaxID=79078 RepID=A0ABU6Q985_9FABA|nr:hypothetical protein [Stylosanthes scabra]